MAVRGKVSEDLGDNLDGFQADLTPEQIDNFYKAKDPHDVAQDLLQGATTRLIYDLYRFSHTQKAYTDAQTCAQCQPVYAAALARETHVSDPLPADCLRLTASFQPFTLA